MSDLGKAIALASWAHRNQLDKQGLPYILHPLAVMGYVRDQSEKHQIVAVLHDTVEDTPVTLDMIRRHGFSEEVVTAVDALTRRDSEPYESYVERAAKNPIAKVVKIADLRHNRYGRGPVAGVEKLHKRYEKALKFLEAA